MPVAAFTAALARLGPFGTHPRLAVAVSGGADSTALALLTQDFCAAHRGALLAIIIDHGLRPGSAAEAALTAQRLAARAIPAKIITLHNLPHSAGLQEAARAARYAALAQAAAEAGFLHLLLGHHAADQSETVAMRAARGPGGAEGIAAWTARGKFLLLRPLLNIPPQALRDFLRAQGMEWIEDPSNQSAKFERVRIRQSGTKAAPEGAAARAAREIETAKFLAAHAQFRPEGFALLDAGTAPLPALAALIRTIGGAAYAPRQAALARLATNLRPATLGGVRILPAGRLGQGWLFAREPSACAPPIPARLGALWDGRFQLNAAPSPGQSFGALGGDTKNYKDFNNLPSIILRSLPALRGPDAAISFPIATSFLPPAPATSHPFLA